ncbi:Protein of unknown function DUF4817 [Trinorchestia longiramus]|nr:Protein of unknown function DUF4817 [Trinorchestia longiramus]
MQLTKEQRIFIVLKYETTKNCEQVRRAFNETFPERNSPEKKTVYRTVRKFNEHGNINNRYKGNSGRKTIQRTENNIAIVQRAIAENPTTSVRCNETNLSKSTFHRILKKDICLHPYKMQIKHELLPCDYARRKEFCNWFISKDQRFTERGTSGIDIDLRRVDIDQCPLPPGSSALNIFAASDKCKKRTTQCVSLPGLGFRRGSYKCECRDGFYFPDTATREKYFNGSIIEEEYEKKLSNQESMYDIPDLFECLSCAPGCDTCSDSRPCVVTLNWLMRTAVLVLALALIACLPAIAFLTWKYGNVKVSLLLPSLPGNTAMLR